MTYHLARNGQQLGTCSGDDATARYARGDILPTDLVWCEGMTEWKPAATVFGQPSGPPTPPPIAPAVPAAPLGTPVAGGGVVPPKKPDSFLVWAILSTVLCCLPAGIAGIIYAAQVDGKYDKGDYAGAEQSAKNARMWTMISAGVGLAVGIIWAAVMVIGAASSAHY